MPRATIRPLCASMDSTKCFRHLRDTCSRICVGAFRYNLQKILKLAVKQAVDVEVDSDNLMTTGIAYGDDPVRLAKIIKDFSSLNEALKIKSGLLKNRILDKGAIIEMAKIPSRQVLLAQLVGILKRPMSDLVYVLKSQLSGLAIVLAGIRDQKQTAEEKKN